MDDLISRQAAIDALRKELCRERVYATPFISFKGCERILNELPSAVRRGRWIENEFGAYCSECGLYAYRSNGIPWKSNYCPICGSFNGEGGENEELQR